MLEHLHAKYRTIKYVNTQIQQQASKYTGFTCSRFALNRCKCRNKTEQIEHKQK